MLLVLLDDTVSNETPVSVRYRVPFFAVDIVTHAVV